MNSATTCGFAGNVAKAYAQTSQQGVVEVEAYSPVTKRTYSMTCTTGPITMCRGGDNAVVYLRR